MDCKEGLTSTGAFANPRLLALFHQICDQQVLIETRKGEQYIGVMSAISPGNEIGLRYAWQKTEKNKGNILPLKKEAQEKLMIRLDDIMVISSLMADGKPATGFATDREYHANKIRLCDAEQELEAWECDEELEFEIGTDLNDKRNNSKRGWNVDEMFKANASLHGVKSTFVEDMSQYTTVDFKATAEQRAKADAIARQIEGSTKSHFYARLENDDYERDLDKSMDALVPEDPSPEPMDIEHVVPGLVEQDENILAASDHDEESLVVEVFEEEQLELTIVQDPLDCDDSPVFTAPPVEGHTVASSVESKKFTFNPNASVFQPGGQPNPAQQQPQQHMPPQQHQQQSHTPMMSPVPSIPPGMTPQHQGPPIMAAPFMPGYMQMPAPYMYYHPQAQMMAGVQPMGRGARPPMGPPPGNFIPRRSGPPPGQVPQMMMPHPGQQWPQAAAQVPYCPQAYYANYGYHTQAPVHMQHHVAPPPGHFPRHQQQPGYQPYPQQEFCP